MVETLDCTKTLKKNSKGADVTKLQKGLQYVGYYLKYNNRSLVVDGKFLTYTEWAVKQFQKNNGLLQDGKVGPLTCKKLNEKINAKAGVSTTSSSSSSSASSSSSSSASKTATVKKSTEAVIDTSKNVYKQSEANLHIEGLHFIMSEITFTKPFKTGSWKTVSMMRGNYNYLTKREQLAFTIVCYLSRKNYTKMRSEIMKLETKVCNVVSKEITSGKYMVSVALASQKKTHVKLTFTLTEYA